MMIFMLFTIMFINDIDDVDRNNHACECDKYDTCILLNLIVYIHSLLICSKCIIILHLVNLDVTKKNSTEVCNCK